MGAQSFIIGQLVEGTLIKRPFIVMENMSRLDVTSKTFCHECWGGH